MMGRMKLATTLLACLLCVSCSKSSKGGAGSDEYLRRSKASEAKVNLSRIKSSIKEAWAMNATLPDSIPMTPAAGACCNYPDRKCPAEPQVFAAAGWGKVNFTMDEPHYYSYELVSSPTEVTVRAKGDLDCNGTLSTFEAHLKVEAGELTGGDLFIDKELE